MIRIAIAAAVFEPIAATLPLGSVGYEAKRSEQGDYFIWLEKRALDRLDALRQPGQGYCDVILRLADIEASRLGRRARPMTRFARMASRSLRLASGWERGGAGHLAEAVATVPRSSCPA